MSDENILPKMPIVRLVLARIPINIRDSPVAKQLPYRKARAGGKEVNPNDVGDMPPKQVSGEVTSVKICSKSYIYSQVMLKVRWISFEK
tara:strand:- start:14215 stop:14481 length:267 start_codon:yes stop_codon:yes gene_type:complete